MAIHSCKDCVAPKRHPGCHDRCPEYLAEKEQYEKRKAEIDRQKRIEAGLTAQTLAGVNKANKARARMKGLKA